MDASIGFESLVRSMNDSAKETRSLRESLKQDFAVIRKSFEPIVPFAKASGNFFKEQVTKSTTARLVSKAIPNVFKDREKFFHTFLPYPFSQMAIDKTGGKKSKIVEDLKPTGGSNSPFVIDIESVHNKLDSIISVLEKQYFALVDIADILDGDDLTDRENMIEEARRQNKPRGLFGVRKPTSEVTKTSNFLESLLPMIPSSTIIPEVGKGRNKPTSGKPKTPKSTKTPKFTKFGNFLKSLLSTIGVAVTSMIASIGPAIGTAITGAISAITGAISAITTTITGALTSALAVLGPAIAAAAVALGSFTAGLAIGKRMFNSSARKELDRAEELNKKEKELSVSRLERMESIVDLTPEEQQRVEKGKEITEEIEKIQQEINAIERKEMDSSMGFIKNIFSSNEQIEARIQSKTKKLRDRQNELRKQRFGETNSEVIKTTILTEANVGDLSAAFEIQNMITNLPEYELAYLELVDSGQIKPELDNLVRGSAIAFKDAYGPTPTLGINQQVQAERRGKSLDFAEVYSSSMVVTPPTGLVASTPSSVTDSKRGDTTINNNVSNMSVDATTTTRMESKDTSGSVTKNDNLN